VIPEVENNKRMSLMKQMTFVQPENNSPFFKPGRSLLSRKATQIRDVVRK